MTTVVLVELALAFLVTAAWPVHYHLSTNGGWWRDVDGPNWYGRNFMALLVDLALLLGLTLASPWVPVTPLWDVVYLWSSALLFGTTAVVVLHRHFLLYRSQHRHR